MRNAHVDANQAAIVEALRQAGRTVETKLSRLGEGTPDLLVGNAGRNFLLEVKTARGKVRPSQKRWINAWNGAVAIVRTPEEAIGASRPIGGVVKRPLTRYSLREVAEAIVGAVVDVYDDLPSPYGPEGGLALGDAVIDALAELGVEVVDREEDDRG
jgi:hypothetical protein